MLEDLLVQKKAEVVAGWRRRIMETYPADTTKFLKDTRDRFGNPVGHNITQETEALFDLLLGEADEQAIDRSLDSIIKIRTVQEFSPAQAVGFVYLLKGVIRETLAEELKDTTLYPELLAFEGRIDGLTLMAFDSYARCLKAIADLRVEADKRRHAKLVERLSTANPPNGDSEPEKDEL